MSGYRSSWWESPNYRDYNYFLDTKGMELSDELKQRMINEIIGNDSKVIDVISSNFELRNVEMNNDKPIDEQKNIKWKYYYEISFIGKTNRRKYKKNIEGELSFDFIPKYDHTLFDHSAIHYGSDRVNLTTTIYEVNDKVPSDIEFLVDRPYENIFYFDKIIYKLKNNKGYIVKKGNTYYRLNEYRSNASFDYLVEYDNSLLRWHNKWNVWNGTEINLNAKELRENIKDEFEIKKYDVIKTVDAMTNTVGRFIIDRSNLKYNFREDKEEHGDNPKLREYETIDLGEEIESIESVDTVKDNDLYEEWVVTPDDVACYIIKLKSGLSKMLVYNLIDETFKIKTGSYENLKLYQPYINRCTNRTAWLDEGLVFNYKNGLMVVRNDASVRSVKYLVKASNPVFMMNQTNKPIRKTKVNCYRISD